MKFHSAILGFALLLAACNSTYGEPLPDSPDSPAMKEIAEGLSDDDKKLLVGYLMRREMANAFNDTGLNDGVTTVGEALTAQEKWAANLSEEQQRAEELKAEVEAERQVVADEIRKTITVAFVDAKLIPENYRAGRYNSYEALTFAIENKGQKAIKAVKGEAVFLDTFGDEYVRVPMQIEEPIPAKERKSVELGMELNEFMDEHKKIMQLDANYDFRFVADHIVFEDGSEIEAPDQVS